MRIESSVISVSWIPREAIEGVVKLPFELGVARDLPPPDRLDDLEGLLGSSIRFANELRAFIEVDDDGRVTEARTPRPGPHGPHPHAAGRDRPHLLQDQLPRPARGARGQRRRGSLHPDGRRPAGHAVAPGSAALPPGLGAGGVVDAGPHHRADGTADFEVVGASSFPRHWIYGHDGTLQAKTGLIDFDTWYRESGQARKNLSPGAVVRQTSQEEHRQGSYRGRWPYAGFEALLLASPEPSELRAPMARRSLA